MDFNETDLNSIIYHTPLGTTIKYPYETHGLTATGYNNSTTIKYPHDYVSYQDLQKIYEKTEVENVNIYTENFRRSIYS